MQIPVLTKPAPSAICAVAGEGPIMRFAGSSTLKIMKMMMTMVMVTTVMMVNGDGDGDFGDGDDHLTGFGGAIFVP